MTLVSSKYIAKKTLLRYRNSTSKLFNRRIYETKISKSNRIHPILHLHLVKSPLLRKNVQNKTERDIQTELRPIIFDYMKKYFEKKNRKNPENMAKKYFYWEGQKSGFDKIKKKTFASINYPDFIIFKPHKIAIEYKKSSNGSVVKQTIGQCIMHTLCDEFEFVYCLFQDENKKKKILESTNNENEGMILEKLWDDYNVCMKFI